jgi:outer membrane protein, heavy metal efflux system
MQTEQMITTRKKISFRATVKGLIGVFAILWLWTPVFADSDTPYADDQLSIIDSYLDMAAKNNPELRRLEHEHQSRLEMIPQVGALPDPQVDIGYFINADDPETFAGRFSVSAMQMFPWYNTRATRREEQSAMAREQMHALQNRKAMLFADIQELWFDYTALVLTIDIVRHNQEIVSDLESIVMIRYETARVGTADLLRIQMEDRRLVTRIENLEDSKNTLKARFNELLNRMPDAEIEIPEQLYARRPVHSEAALITLARQNNPEIEQFEAMEETAEHRTLLARLAGRPEIGIGLEIMGRDFATMAMMDMNEGYVGMVSIKIPLYRSNYDAKIRQALEDKQSVTQGKYQALNAIARQMEENLVNWRASDRNLRLLENELIPRARQAFDVLSEAYGAGGVSFEEVLQVQRELLDLDIERINLLAEQNRVMARIEALYAARPGR